MRKPASAQLNIAGLIIFLGSVAWPQGTLGHAFGPRYNSPIPLSLFVAAAGLVVGLSFVVMFLFVSKNSTNNQYHYVNFKSTGICRLIASNPVKAVAQITSVIVFTLILVTGLAGSTHMMTNFSTVFVWIVWWTGMVFVQAFVGDVWAVINPWKILYDRVAWIRRRLGFAAGRVRKYPNWLGYWPAVFFFLIFTWLENVSLSATEPFVLALLVITYSLITWLGMGLYGKHEWLRHGEVFSVVFGLVARFGPIGSKDTEINSPWELRSYAIGLLPSKGVAGSLMVMVLLLLASVSFDGFEETPVWVKLQEDIQTSQWLKPYRPVLINFGVNLRALIKTFAMLAGSAIFIVAFVFISALADRFGGKALLKGGGMYFFVLTLVPIAIAYHVAHYLTYFLIAGQVIIPVLSDPFGYGWNLFGTAAYQINVGIINIKSVWYIAVTAIVIGHIIAVYLAHEVALRRFHSTRAALCSQIPIMALMVGYTMTSLWILAQPILQS